MNKKNILLVGLVIAFIFLTVLIKVIGTFKIDSIVYKFVIAFKSDELTNIFKFVTLFGTFKVCFGISIIIFLIFRSKKYLIIPITPVLIKLLNLFVKLIINRPRPNILRLISINESSYPSGHAMLSLTLFGLLIYYIYRKISKNSVKWILITLISIFIILIGISRIYLGVHYFTDIMGGYLLGIIYLLLITNYRKLRDD